MMMRCRVFFCVLLGTQRTNNFDLIEYLQLIISLGYPTVVVLLDAIASGITIDKVMTRTHIEIAT
jgi:hypothetical protein